MAFDCKVCVKGAGRSKKAAKRNAAAKMMAHIKSMSGGDGDQPPKVEESDEEEEIPLVGCSMPGVIYELHVENYSMGVKTLEQRKFLITLAVFHRNPIVGVGWGWGIIHDWLTRCCCSLLFSGKVTLFFTGQQIVQCISGAANCAVQHRMKSSLYI